MKPEQGGKMKDFIIGMLHMLPGLHFWPVWETVVQGDASGVVQALGTGRRTYYCIQKRECSVCGKVDMRRAEA